MFLMFGGWNMLTTNHSHHPINNEKSRVHVQAAGKNEITVLLERRYIDGEVSEEVRNEKKQSIKKILAKYHDWKVVDLEEDEIVLQKKINDISPLMKTNGYIGLSKDATLSIFNGKPKNKEVIQSFFQLDIKKLEGHKQELLKKGVRITSKKSYEKWVETLKPYSVTKNQS